jgi:carbamate kinase
MLRASNTTYVDTGRKRKQITKLNNRPQIPGAILPMRPRIQAMLNYVSKKQNKQAKIASIFELCEDNTCELLLHGVR